MKLPFPHRANTKICFPKQFSHKIPQKLSKLNTFQAYLSLVKLKFTDGAEFYTFIFLINRKLPQNKQLFHHFPLSINIQFT